MRAWRRWVIVVIAGYLLGMSVGWIIRHRGRPAPPIQVASNTTRPATEPVAIVAPMTLPSPTTRYLARAGFDYYVVKETLCFRSLPNGDLATDVIPEGMPVQLLRAADGYCWVQPIEGERVYVAAGSLKHVEEAAGPREPVKRPDFQAVAPVLVADTTTRPATVPALPLPQAQKADEIEQAIKSAIAYLRSQQAPDGTWEKTESAIPQGRRTAIVVAALLRAGESAADTRLTRAIHFLDANHFADPAAQAWCALAWRELHGYSGRHADIQQNFKDLLARQADLFPGTKGKEPGLSALSAAQLDALISLGIEAPQDLIQKAVRQWRSSQQGDGGWSRAGDAFSSRASAEGLYSLLTLSNLTPDVRDKCEGNIRDAGSDAAFAWLSNASLHAPLQNADAATIDWITQAMARTGRRRMGNADWYSTAADTMRTRQRVDGAITSIPAAPNDIAVETAYALRALADCDQPIFVSKLSYNLVSQEGHIREGHWTQRPDDAVHWVASLGKDIEHRFGWQIVDLNESLESLCCAPVLYLSGNETLHFTSDEVTQLRNYIEAGGMIVGNADCKSEAFSQSFRAIGVELCRGKYRFRELPAEHPIFTRQLSSRWTSLPRVQGLSNGSHELMLLLPDDPARGWQTGRYHDDSQRLGADILLYAVDRDHLRGRWESSIVRVDPTTRATRHITVARLEYGNNWDPEPGAWPRLMAVVHNRLGIDGQCRETVLGTGALTSATDLAHLTCTSDVQLLPAQRQEFYDYVTGGGTLVIDAAGGSSAFARVMREELTQIFPDAPLIPIDTLPSATTGLTDQFRYTDFARDMLRNQTGPRLWGISVGGRVAVYFSDLDLSTGLVGAHVDGVLGYTPESATDLMSDIISLVARRK